MDTPINIFDYSPTRSSPLENEPTTAAIETLFEALVAQTKAIMRFPYDPKQWLARARTLIDLAYPELACGDAWKAEHCCRTLLRQYNTAERIRLGANSGFWMFDQQEASQDERKVNMQQLLLTLQSTASTLISSICEGLGVIEIVPQPYPWLASRHRTRSEALLQQINRELVASQPLDTQDWPYCIVKRGAHNVPGSEFSADEALGIFAQRAIPAGTTIVKDKGEIWACTAPTSKVWSRSLGYVFKHPSPSALNDDMETALLHWIKDVDRVDTDRALLRIRSLTRCVRDGVLHPLDHTVVARLRPAYRNEESLRFSLEADIVLANKALLQAGIDILANHNFDTWVLLTIDARLDNNCWSEPNARCLSSLFALFNHSCEPNVVWEHQDDHRIVHMRVNRDIEVGEQLFVQYNSYLDDRPVRERQQALRRWLTEDCDCTRCTREMAAEVVVQPGSTYQDAEWNSGVVDPPGLLW
ncbi:hypothetical protein AMS68_001531 [Peltaster fructicola]|uniref:Histone-lysine N-methyltransferase SET5 n=1 Tax=Peltaster fructicola TaxID=286661 RepID=A0A6H0XMR2_9PEZI|nr:hypothetical protein AMS68_001531 [Peltaster fructicola]